MTWVSHYDRSLDLMLLTAVTGKFISVGLPRDVGCRARSMVGT